MSVDQPGHLAEQDIRELFALFQEAFDASEEGFREDLLDKERVLRVWGSSGLCAFSSLTTFRPDPGYRVFYSGDTFVSTEARMGHRLPAMWAQYVFQELPREKGVEDFWLLLCSGYRTYRILPTFFSSFSPGPEADPALEEWKERWANLRFGELYSGGIVKPSWPTILKEPEPPKRLLEDPHVKFFLEANPGYREGDELVCLVSLNTHKLTPAGRRLACSSVS